MVSQFSSNRRSRLRFSKPITWISGNGSCGKTKAARAEAFALRKQNKRVLFWTGEELLQGFRDAVKGNRYGEFKSFLRSHNFLFIDDLDYVLRNLHDMQTEIGELLSELAANSKTKTVITARSAPASLQNLRLPVGRCAHIDLSFEVTSRPLP